MTVKELVERLQMIKPDTLVMVLGYEGGLDDVNVVESASVQLNVNAEIKSFGPHESLSDREKDALLSVAVSTGEPPSFVEAVVLMNRTWKS